MRLTNVHLDDDSLTWMLWRQLILPCWFQKADKTSAGKTHLN